MLLPASERSSGTLLSAMLPASKTRDKMATATYFPCSADSKMPFAPFLKQPGPPRADRGSLDGCRLLAMANGPRRAVCAASGETPCEGATFCSEHPNLNPNPYRHASDLLQRMLGHQLRRGFQSQGPSAF